MESEDEHSFRPSINSISAKLDGKKQGKDTGRKRWELLYELNERIKDESEKRQRRKEDEETKKVNAFSYQPLLIAQGPLLSGTIIYSGVNMRSESIENRTTRWAQQRHDKLQSLAEAQRTRELNGCTFRPQVHDPPKNWMNRSAILSGETSSVNVKSIKKHVENQRKARDARKSGAMTVREEMRPQKKSRAKNMSLSKV